VLKMLEHAGEKNQTDEERLKSLCTCDLWLCYVFTIRFRLTSTSDGIAISAAGICNKNSSCWPDCCDFDQLLWTEFSSSSKSADLE